jgi:hypothetical protein
VIGGLQDNGITLALGTDTDSPSDDLTFDDVTSPLG